MSALACFAHQIRIKFCCQTVTWEVTAARTKLWVYLPKHGKFRAPLLQRNRLTHSWTTTFVFHSLTRLPARACRSSTDQTPLLWDERDAICGLCVCFEAVFRAHALLAICDLRAKLLHCLRTSEASDSVQADPPPPLPADPAGPQQMCQAWIPQPARRLKPVSL